MSTTKHATHDSISRARTEYRSALAQGLTPDARDLAREIASDSPHDHAASVTDAVARAICDDAPICDALAEQAWWRQLDAAEAYLASLVPELRAEYTDGIAPGDYEAVIDAADRARADASQA